MGEPSTEYKPDEDIEVFCWGKWRHSRIVDIEPHRIVIIDPRKMSYDESSGQFRPLAGVERNKVHTVGIGIEEVAEWLRKRESNVEW